MPTRMPPQRRPMPTRPTGPIQSLSMAYFTKNPMARTSTPMPILLTRFSPMNFSRSGCLSKKPGGGGLPGPVGVPPWPEPVRGPGPPLLAPWLVLPAVLLWMASSSPRGWEYKGVNTCGSVISLPGVCDGGVETGLGGGGAADAAFGGVMDAGRGGGGV